MTTKFKLLPKEVQEKMLNEQVRQGNARNEEVFNNCIISDFNDGGFTWDDSEEGYEYWEGILDTPDDDYEFNIKKSEIPVEMTLHEAENKFGIKIIL